ncbi:MAG TPA: fumarylacetoacetate hydrolase family protein [Actinomycetes bacterium]|nr:fumarylacetoacetate hydrolase family protein [Actinomycetes bacterium]
MRIARFTTGDGASFGVVEGEDEADLTIRRVEGHPFAPFQLTEDVVALADARLLAPVLPSKVVAVGRNYAEHAKEMGGNVDPTAEPPIVFIKPSTSVVGPGDAVQYPVGISEEVSYEGELAVVIVRLCREVPPSRVRDVVLGFTCANDVTARDLQRAESQWGRAKGFDTFCPLGPWVSTDVDPADLAITTTVNGELKQAGRTSQMVRSIDELVSHISMAMTLLPGDVILTGTPAGVGPLAVGDQVSVTIEQVGTLMNRVVARG